MTDNNIFVSRLNEYADSSYVKADYLKFTDFLDEFESATAVSVYKNRYFDNYKLFGGYEESTRKILCVFSDEPPKEVPIVVLKLSFNNKDYLSHRNILGALMNLNIKRSLIGDICIFDDYAYVICKTVATEIIRNELTSVGKSRVEAEEISLSDFNYSPKMKEETHIIASERLDSIVSAVCNFSRSMAEDKISSGQVFVNGEIIKNGAKKISESSKISIRGLGKIIIEDMSGRTHKDRIKLVVKKFI